MATGALYTIHEVSTADRDIAANLRLVTFSFDPEHDTPTVMSEYGDALRPGGAGSEWLFLTTRNRGALEPILKAYGQRVDPKKNPLDPLGPFYHVLRVYLIDRDGMIRNIYSYGMLDPRVVLADVRTLLMESTTARK
jgi:cytochrome oxidase Cu insertion factor (SCO1/SenC/PrrC family)